jgi:hypothetical protein
MFTFPQRPRQPVIEAFASPKLKKSATAYLLTRLSEPERPTHGQSGKQEWQTIKGTPKTTIELGRQERVVLVVGSVLLWGGGQGLEEGE